MRRAPNLLVPGTQKSGTTFLCAHLARHPGIYFSNPKELHFFGRRAIDHPAFEGYLREHFPEESIAAKGSALRYIGEGSTTYFQREPALENILRYLGRDIRVIVCLRHPVEKAISFYLHNWKRGRLVGTERIVDVDRDGVSVYRSTQCARHARRWIDALGRDRILFLLFDLLKKDSAAFVRAATDFLEIEPVKRVEKRRINMGFSLARDGDCLVPVLNGSQLPESQAIPRFPLADLEQLMDAFSRDVSRTEGLIGEDLSAWKTLPDFGTYEGETASSSDSE